MLKRTDLDKFHHELQRIHNLPGIESDHQLAAKELSDLIKQGLLSYYDIINNPEKFFAFHEAISEYSGLEGFGIRFTVQYNLFAGTIMTLGSQYHKDLLLNWQKTGDLGCFMLTEYSPGVMSGMICKTVATMNDNGFILNTLDIVNDINNENINFEKTVNRKNWISQGLYAKHGIVCAQLIIEGKNHGIHPFLVSMNQPGIFINSNGEKTVARSLDNAMIVFKNLLISKQSLMYPLYDSSIDQRLLQVPIDKKLLSLDQRLISVYKDISTERIIELMDNPGIGFKRIASRLNSGRLCIALSMTRYLETQFKKIKNNTFNKVVHTSNKYTQTLDTIPSIYCMLETNQKILESISQFVKKVVTEYCEKIKQSTVNKNFELQLNDDILERIIVAKILVANMGYLMMNELKVKMGSNSLFAEKGMGSIDILLCARFAQGEMIYC